MPFFCKYKTTLFKYSYIQGLKKDVFYDFIGKKVMLKTTNHW